MTEPAQVIPYTSRGRMTEAEYEKERARLRELYGDNAKQANAKREQALASLAYQSGWTGEQLAHKEGCKLSQVYRRLRFGQFLVFLANDPSGSKIETLPINLTEGRFRSYWDRTEKTGGNDRIRFRDIKRLMDEDTRLCLSNAPKGFGRQIMEHFADGKWHSIETITETIDAPKEDILSTLNLMRDKGSYKSKCEIKRVGKSTSYRIFHQKRTISSDELVTKLTPIIEGLIAEGKKHSATISISAVARLAALLKRQLDEWRE